MSADIPLSIEALRQDAKRLHRAYEAGEVWAVQRVRQHPPRRKAALKRADFLHIVAQETGFDSWPKLKAAAETSGLDRAQALQRLKIALAHGQASLTARLLERFPDLAQGLFGLECALYDIDAVRATLARDPAQAVTQRGPRSPMAHLCFSRWFKGAGREADMLAVAEALVAQGASVDDGIQHGPHRLSVLYGAVAADNMVLVRWLLEHGANPNDGESLYHATELGHREGLKMLLDAGADPNGTNALLRAMDFNDHDAVALLLAHGARVDDFNLAEVGGVAPMVCPALHQAARRGCDARMAGLILGGVDPDLRWQGVTAFELARVFGNAEVAQAIADGGADTTLSPAVHPLVDAVEGRAGGFIDPAKLPEALTDLLRDMVTRPDLLGPMQRLVARGLPYDQPDRVERVTPTHAAGWAGLPEVLGWLLSLRPDMGFVNGHGGTLLTTILHGAENNPDRHGAGRDYIACLDMVLHHGVALPRAVIEQVGADDLRAFLTEWAEDHPGQVV